MVLGLRGARARSQGLLCTVLGALSPGPGCTDSSVRAVPEEAQRQKLGSTAACGFCFALRVAKRRRASLGPGTRRDRVGDRWTQRPPCKSHASVKPGCSPTLFQAAVAPGGHAARASSRRCPPLDARATAPSGGLCSSQKHTPWCLSRAAPAAASAQSSKRTLSLRGATRCPAASCHHGGGRLAPLPLALGRGPPLFINELGLPHDHLYHNSEVAVGARRDHDQETTHKRNGAQGRRACLHRSITMQTHQRRARAHKFNCQGL